MDTNLILLGDLLTETWGEGVASVDSSHCCLNPGTNYRFHCPD